VFTSEHLLLPLLTLPIQPLEAPAPSGADPEEPPARGTFSTAVTFLAGVTTLFAALGRRRSLSPVAILAADISPVPSSPSSAPPKRRPPVVWGRPALSAAPRSRPRTT
jgi:hypothetical protein